MDLKTAVELQIRMDREAFERQIGTVNRELIPRSSTSTASYITLNHLATNASRAAAELLVIAGRIEANERVLLALLDPAFASAVADVCGPRPCPKCGMFENAVCIRHEPVRR